MTLSDLREALHDVLAECDGPEGRPRLYRILRSIAQRAEAGDVKAAALILDRAFGAPKIESVLPQSRHTIYIGVAGTSHESDPKQPTNGGVAVAERFDD
jgi:hypothetical protein